MIFEYEGCFIDLREISYVSFVFKDVHMKYHFSVSLRGVGKVAEFSGSRDEMRNLHAHLKSRLRALHDTWHEHDASVDYTK